MVKDTDIAWLAGAIEADGSVGMGFHAHKLARKDGFAVKPVVTLTNQDEAIISHALTLFTELSGKAPRVILINVRKTGYQNSKPSLGISLVGQGAVFRFLTALAPFMIGAKKHKAELLLKFLESRLRRRSLIGVRKGSGQAPYNSEELGTIIDFYDVAQRKGGRRNPAVRRIITEYQSAAVIDKETANAS
jgi:hypothetical protein